MDSSWLKMKTPARNFASRIDIRLRSKTESVSFTPVYDKSSRFRAELVYEGVGVALRRSRRERNRDRNPARALVMLAGGSPPKSDLDQRCAGTGW